MTVFDFCCWGGYVFGIIEIAPDGQAVAHAVHPGMHLVVSIMLFSVSVAPVGQT
jgi:hypothetical protein